MKHAGKTLGRIPGIYRTDRGEVDILADSLWLRCQSMTMIGGNLERR